MRVRKELGSRMKLVWGSCTLRKAMLTIYTTWCPRFRNTRKRKAWIETKARIELKAKIETKAR